LESDSVFGVRPDSDPSPARGVACPPSSSPHASGRLGPSLRFPSAPVAQRIEHPPPKRGAASSILAGRTSLDGAPPHTPAPSLRGDPFAPLRSFAARSRASDSLAPYPGSSLRGGPFAPLHFVARR